MQKQKEWYDNFYTKQDNNFLNHVNRHTLTASLCNGKVADIGACMGILSDYYRGDYTGFDFSQVALDKGKEIRRNDARLVFYDCSDLSHLDIERYDTFVMAEFLEHFDDDKKILEPIFKRAKLGTRLIVSVPNGDRIPDESHARTFTIPELRKKFVLYGKVKFYNWSGAENHILMTCDLGIKNDNQLSLTMIVKDEAKGLENCILSCIEFIDEVVISVDDATTDETYKIAQRYSDKLFSHKWENDFAAARNTLLPHISTKWALWLDGHEYVKSIGHFVEMCGKDVDGLNVQIIMEDNTSFIFPRILRNYVKWNAAVHNYPVLKTWADCFDFEMVHDRDNLQSIEAAEARNIQRSKMIFSILTDNFKKDKTDSRALYYLGQQCVFEKRWLEAKQWYKKFLKIGTVKGERWTAYYTLGICSANLKQQYRSLFWFLMTNAVMPGRWEVFKRIGAVCLNLGFYSIAARYFVMALNDQVGNFSNYPEPRDDAETWDFLGRCLFNLKKYTEAKIAWERSVELEKNKDESKIFKDRVETLERLLKSM